MLKLVIVYSSVPNVDEWLTDFSYLFQAMRDMWARVKVRLGIKYAEQYLNTNTSKHEYKIQILQQYLNTSLKYLGSEALNFMKY